MQSVQLTTSDGVILAADVLESTDPASPGVVVCHPHPQFGGDRHNPVVDRVFHRLADAGHTSLRFDFRAEYADGVGERNDVIAAVDELGRRAAEPVFVVGYSFGAAVALGTPDARIRGIAAIAPPLTMMPVAAPNVPTLVLMPRHDQFTAVDAASGLVDAWPDATFRVVESADHFLVGAADTVADDVIAWLALHSDHAEDRPV